VAFSTAVANIEGRHATKLFHWAGRGIEPSNARRVFNTEARGVLAGVQAAKLKIWDIRQNARLKNPA